MRCVTPYRLWLGHAGDLRDLPAIMAAEIEAVMELADSEPAANLPRDLIRLRFPLSDGGDNPDWLLRLATNSIAALLHAKVGLLVCCSAGISRSVCLAAAGLALAECRPFAECLRLIAANGPIDVSPRLYAQLHQSLFNE